MKSLISRLSLLVLLTGLTALTRTAPAYAQEGNPQMERLERLEQHVKELAERQEQFMRRIGAQMERQGDMAQAGPEHLRQPQPPLQGAHPPMLPAGAPPAARHLKGIHDALGFLFFIGFICNILMAVWIFTDIRKRGEGSAIFVAMALLAGIPAALIYAVTRLGDKKPSAS
jgi:hypothetical protein